MLLSYALLAAAIVAADQLTKYLAVLFLSERTIVLIPGFLELRCLRNSGMALSLLSGGRWLFIVVGVVFLAAVVWLFAKNVLKKPVENWCVAAIAGGAIGNLIDRIVSGEVIDMICVPWFSTFNVADMFITVPAVILLVYILFFDKAFLSDRPKSPEDTQDDAHA